RRSGRDPARRALAGSEAGAGRAPEPVGRRTSQGSARARRWPARPPPAKSHRRAGPRGAPGGRPPPGQGHPPPAGRQAPPPRRRGAKWQGDGGEGGKVGPDLTGVAVHPREELLVHVLDPSRSVEGNFLQYSVATTDGRVINGLLASESKTAVELVDTEGKAQTI